jgi:hypothetical protein
MQQRVRLVVGLLFFGVCLVSGFTFAQDNQVRVGVTVLGSASGLTGEAGRDRLVKDLNKQKKSEVQAVPLTASAGDQISEEARQKNCQFVVFTTQTESHAESHNEGAKAGMSTNIPEYHANVEYKVYRVSDPATPVATGSGKAHDIGSQGDVVGQALDSVAKKVSADIKNAGTTK